MTLAVPLSTSPQSWLVRANPAAKLGAAAILMLSLFLSLDAITAALVLAALLGVIATARLRTVALLRRMWPLLLAAAGVGVLNAALTPNQAGSVVVDLGPLVLTSGAIWTGASLALRLIAIALSGVLAVGATDPTDLADSLIQQLRAPARFAIGTLAAVRLLPLLAEEWDTIRRARRARGIEAGRSPAAAIALFASATHALLVAAIRRGTRMAMAMDGRGFGSTPCRTIARPQRLRGGDWLLLVGAASVAILAIAVSVALGTWRFLLS